jgi:deazaflavin-dependent oxidoreductase (nitroreductase family)
MSQTPTVPPAVNRAMKFVLRSPLHGIVSRSVLLVTFTGRKSGKSYTTPVSYSQAGSQVTIFTHAAWWKNLHPGEPVSLRIRGRDVRALPEPVAGDGAAIADSLSAHLRQVPSDARYYGVTTDPQGDPDAAAVAEAVQTVVMVRFWLC